MSHISAIPALVAAAPDRTDPAFALGYDVLGPVFHRWLIGLDQFVSYFAAPDTRFLFCARAGVRIQELFDGHRARLGRTAEPKATPFWISRVAVCKGVFARVPALAASHIAREYGGQPMRAVVAGLLRHQPGLLGDIALADDEATRPPSELADWLVEGTPAARRLRDYLHACSIDFDTYVDETMADARRGVLIDSGWQGSVQSLLTHAFPARDWRGLYVGRMLLPGHDPAIADKAIGILFERNGYDPAVPASAITQCRHLIETILEPNGPSVEEVAGGRFRAEASRQIGENLAARVDPDRDVLFMAISTYLDEHGDVPVAEAFARYERAVRELARILISPARSEARALVCKDRSADFGKMLTLPVLVEPAGAADGPDDRIGRSLWPQGQIALEYEPTVARGRHAVMAGPDAQLRYFDPLRERSDATDPAQLPEDRLPLVAIVTRTKNRPFLLRRAAASVAAQSYRNYLWVIVNDGGDEAPVRAVIERSAVDPRRILLVSNATSLGMEAASNLGIRSVASDLVTIHDDDDSWHADFLARTVAYLSSPVGVRYGGVVTRSTYISEEIAGDTIVERARQPFIDWIRNIHMTHLARENLFPPIAFVYRRACWEAIGGYCETLPVLGDWFFNLEFLVGNDIAVLPEPLAYYHHRDRQGPIGSYANSISGGAAMHEEFSAVVRNAFVRKHPGSPIAAAILMAMMPPPAGAPAPIAPDRSGAERSFIDLADKRWTAHFVNDHVARRLAVQDARFTITDLLGPGASWHQVCAAVTRLDLPVPPPPDFAEEDYLGMYADVAAAVAGGAFPNGFRHYLRYGRAEGRARPVAAQHA